MIKRGNTKYINLFMLIVAIGCLGYLALREYERNPKEIDKSIVEFIEWLTN